MAYQSADDGRLCFPLSTTPHEMPIGISCQNTAKAMRSFFLSFFSQLYLLKKRKKERLGRENSCFRAVTPLTWWTQALPANHLFTNMHCPWILSYNIWRLLFFKSALWKKNFHKSTLFKYTVQGVQKCIQLCNHHCN